MALQNNNRPMLRIVLFYFVKKKHPYLWGGWVPPAPPRGVPGGRPSPCRFLCIFVLAGECIEEWNGAAGLGRERVKSSRLTAHMGRNEPFANTTRCLAKPIFKRNGEAQSLYVLDPSVAITRHSSPPFAHKSPTFLGKIIKWRGLLPYRKYIALSDFLNLLYVWLDFMS